MKLTAQIAYAFDALLDIAERHGERKPVNLKEISKRHAIPEKYLLQVMVKLKKEGLVYSRRGLGGGFRLAVEPEKISMKEVVQILGHSRNSRGHNQPKLDSIWDRANEAFYRELSNYNLLNLIEKR